MDSSEFCMENSNNSSPPSKNNIFLYTSSDFKIIHKSMSIQINFKILLFQDFRKVP